LVPDEGVKTMDVVQKTRDLINKAVHAGTSEVERNEAAVAAVRLIDKYELLGTRKRVDVAAEIIERVTNPAFVEGVASRAEQIVSGAERVMGSVKKLSDLSRRVGVGEKRRGRRFSGR